MRMGQACAECMYGKQAAVTDDEAYLKTIREILQEHVSNDSSPQMGYRFSQAYEARFGKEESYAPIRRQYNDLVLSLSGEIRRTIEESDDPLLESLIFCRTGNYIDFGALDHVDPKILLKLLEENQSSEHDKVIYESFVKECAEAERFLLITDNCGEIVLDKLMLEQLHQRFPELKLKVMVRGGEAVNDAIAEDAEYAGIPELAEVIGSGRAVAGTVPSLLSEEAMKAMQEADVILAKGQGNYESLSGEGWHVFYLFLCKCEVFADRFGVPRLTGMFTEELQ